MAQKEITISYSEYDSAEELASHYWRLLDEAVKATESSYAPYSNFNVGAAVLMENGEIVTGSSLSIPLFDWGERKARIKAQEIAIKMYDMETDEERKSIEIAVRKSCRSLRNLEAQIAIAEQSVQNAQLTYDLNAERYRNGELTGMEMNQFQTQLSNQKMSYVSTLINYKLELLNLKIISLYDFENDKHVIPMSVVPQDVDTKEYKK